MTVELDRRLKLGVDRLREARKGLEELTQLADSLGPLLGVRSRKGRAKATAGTLPASKTARGRAPQARTESTPPPSYGVRPTPSTAPSAPAVQDEVPEWRKLFPALSANVPTGRSK
ncbi:hypothetical protein DAT35_54280 [Vitiosangium sp. GDMCC 1.1324]|nr:hypothetical protein DAT35_54280 [Vitiosangium sp. GDMCC 1.1324]